MEYFENFDDKTIKSNNDIYHEYFNLSNKGKNRSSAVAWSGNSQMRNFNLVSKHISTGDSILDYGCGIGDLIKHLEDKKISDYLGVDINPTFIKFANRSYPDNKFKLITGVNELNTKMDDVCAIGVFTWYITKNEFISIIHKLYELANKQVLITCLYGNPDYTWKGTYRYYDEIIFKKLFPKYNMEFYMNVEKTPTMLVRIVK
jgi:cyclopropane fatty-acyl-phospholipid synthase-like methyltransferase